MLTCPVNVCVVSVQTADFNGICSAFARRQSAAQGMGDKRRQKIPRRTAGRELRLVHDRVVEVGETEKKIHFNSFSLKDEREKKKKRHSALLTFPRLQENRVGHDIFNLHCQNVSPEQSRYISLSGKRRFF